MISAIFCSSIFWWSALAGAQLCGDDGGANQCTTDDGTDAGTDGDAGETSVDPTPVGPGRPVVQIPEPNGSNGGAGNGSAGNGGAGNGGAGNTSGGSSSPGSSSPACSCTHDANDDGRGRVHVCTGSFERDVCEDLVCEKDSVRGVACSTRRVSYCCQMPNRGLYSHLYEDCENDNCEAGFFAQCEDFGGTIIEGPCDTPESIQPYVPDPRDDDDDDWCSVAPGRRHEPGSLAFFALTALGLSRLRRRR